MEKKLTIEELRAKYKALGEELEAREKAEAEERKAKLAAEKDARYKEVVHAYENFEELRSKYVEDYGRFTFKTKSNDEEVCDFILKSFGLM